MAKAQGSKPKIFLHDSSKTRQAAVMRDINKVLAEHGVAGRVAKLHLKATAAAAADGCPPGKHRETVCRTQPDGTIVCTQECV